MPGTRCAVASCKNSLVVTRKRKSEECVTYHSFPSDVTLQKLWMSVCNRELRGNKIESLRVCSEHFTLDDYERDLRAELMNMKVRRILKKGAVPSLKLGAQAQTQVTSLGRVVKSRRPVRKTRKKKVNEPMQRFHVISAILDVEQEKVDSVSKEKDDLILKNRTLEMKLARVQQELHKAMDMYRTRAAAMGLTIRQLKQEVQMLKRQKGKPTNGLARANEVLKRFLSENQVRMVLYGMKRVNWTPNEIFAASTLKNISKRAYIYLQKKMKYPLPGLSTLGRYSLGMKTEEGSDSEDESDLDDIGSDCEEYGAGLDHMREASQTNVVEYEIEISDASSQDASSRTISSDTSSDVNSEKASSILDRAQGSHYSHNRNSKSSSVAQNPVLSNAPSAVQSKTFSLDETHLNTTTTRNAIQSDISLNASLEMESTITLQHSDAIPNTLPSSHNAHENDLPSRNCISDESLQSSNHIPGDSLSAAAGTPMHGHPLCVPSQNQFPDEPLTAPSQNPISDTSLLDISRNVIPRAYAMDMPSRNPFSNSAYANVPQRTVFCESSSAPSVPTYSVANSMHEPSRTHFPDASNVSTPVPFTDASSMTAPHRVQYSSACSVDVAHRNQYPGATHYGQITDGGTFHSTPRTHISGEYAFHMQQTLQ